MCSGLQGALKYLVHKCSALQAGADPDAADAESGSKPIHAAAFSGHAAVVELLLPLTQPRQGEKWSVEALMAETSSAGSAASPPHTDKVRALLLLAAKDRAPVAEKSQVLLKIP